MEKYEFNIEELFLSFFGYRNLPYPKMVFNRAADPLSDKGVNYYGKNALGNTVFMPVTLIHKQPLSPTQEGTPPQPMEVLLENTVITLTCKKTLVETPLTAKRGTVKEEISTSDWDITIKGIMVGRNTYPEEEVKKLRDLFEVNKALQISNALTTLLLNGEERVVIKSLELTDNRGIEHIQPFSMSLVSDTEFDLYMEQ